MIRTNRLRAAATLLGLLALAAAPAAAQKKGNSGFNPNAPLPKPKPKAAPNALAKENATASDSLARKAKLELPLVLKPSVVDESAVTLPYELPYSGMVELRLYEGDSTGRLMFQENYIQNPGDNRIRLKAKAFKSGKSYWAVMTYKGKRYAQALNF